MSSKATGLGRVPANLLALAVAVAFFISAMQWRGPIIFVTVLALFSFGMRYLYRNHPLARIFITDFVAASSACGGDKPAVQVAAALVQEAPSEG